MDVDGKNGDVGMVGVIILLYLVFCSLKNFGEIYCCEIIGVWVGMRLWYGLNIIEGLVFWIKGVFY